MIYRILLVEDDELILKSLQKYLEYQKFTVTSRDNLTAATRTIQSERFDLIITDLNLPDGSGYDLCTTAKKLYPEVPVIMLTARTDEESAVKGMSLGADDYVRKPFGTKELVMRIERLLGKSVSVQNETKFGPLKVDLKKRQAWYDDTEIHLGRREFDILALLAKKAGDVVTRNEILNAFDEKAEVYDRTIDSHLSHLRRKIKDAGGTLTIRSVYGVGYRLDNE